MKTNIYTSDGWLDVPALAAMPAWLRVIIGKRQIGKTYGVNKYMIDSGRRFILMRRTNEEVAFLGANPAVNPFAVYDPEYKIRMDKAGKILNIIDETAGDKQIGICLGLPTVATIRGFAAQSFTDVVFDEFIPEKHVMQRKTEGEALLNAYTTINGNRELEGRPPVNLWLLANSNNINSPILSSLGLIDYVLKMREQRKEVYQGDGFVIVQPGSEQVTKRRRSTAMMEHLNRTRSAQRFVGMALDNEWSYNTSELVRKMSLAGLRPLCAFSDLYFWESISCQLIYVCHSAHKVDHYDNTELQAEQFRDRYYWIFDAYRAGRIRFADVFILTRVRELFDIKF